MENSNVALSDPDDTIGSNIENTDNIETSPVKLSECTKDQLLDMVAILEADLQARDIVLATLQNEKVRHLLYEAKYGRRCLDDPYLALERDGAVLGEDLNEDMLMRAAHEAKLYHLDALLVAQHNLVDKIRAQVEVYQSKYSDVCNDLERERQIRLQNSPSVEPNQNSECQHTLLNEELAFERNCSKAYKDDLAIMFSVVEKMRTDIEKHKQVALNLIRERKLLAECLLKDRQRLKELEDAALHEDRAAIERNFQEKLTLVTDEKSLLEERLRREEAMGKATRAECDRLRQQVDFLQEKLNQQQVSPSRQSLSHSATELKSSPTPYLSGNSTILRNNNPIPSQSPIAITGRVPLDHAPTLAQKALASGGVSPYSYRSPVSPATSVGSISSPNVRSPLIPPPPSTTPVTPNSLQNPRLNVLPGQSAVLTTSSGQRISLHVSPSKSASQPNTPSPMVVQVSQSVPNRPGSSTVPVLNTPNANSTMRTSAPAIPSRTGPTPLSPANNNSVAVSSSFNITIRPDSKGVSSFVGASNMSAPPLDSYRLGSAVSNKQNFSSSSPSSAATYQLDSPTESTRYLTIKKMGVATSNPINN